jgi:uncharacterized protein
MARKSEDSMDPIGTVRTIWRYPVSSTGGEQLANSRLAMGGVEGDRTWGIVDLRDGSIVGPEKRSEWRTIPTVFSRTGASGLQVKTPWSDWLDAGSNEADAAISSFLGFEAALRPHVPHGEAAAGRIAPRYRRADILLTTTASMRRLADLLGAPEEVDDRRFRPNIVVDTDTGLSGFVELEWVGREIRIGEAVIRVVEPCVRCPFTTLAQDGLSFMPKVLHTISEAADRNFGVLCEVVTEGQTRTGDRVQLIQD